MSNCFIILGLEDYESSVIIKVFKNKEKADKLCKKYNDYNKTKLEFPEDDKDFEEWFKKDEKWRSNHPSGNFCVDGYIVIENEYIE
jgi:hypothetical protein